MSLLESTVEATVRDLSRAIRTGEPVSFFCGAGISRDQPSLAPDWAMLRDGLLASLLSQATRGNALSATAAQRGKHAWARVKATVKPEVVLHILEITLRERLQSAYNVLAGGRPNVNHLVLAHLASSYPPVALATTNFDTYLESALSKHGKPRIHGSERDVGDIASFCDFRSNRALSRHRVPLLKPHGTLAIPETIRATLRAVGKPASNDLRQALQRLVANRHLVVVGYSGNDYDLFPALQILFPKARSVRWVCCDTKRLNPALKVIHFNGGLVLGDARTFFSKLAAACGLRVPVPTICRDPCMAIKERMDVHLGRWAHDIDPFDAGFAIANLLRHTGRWVSAAALCGELARFKQASPLHRARALNLLALCVKRSAPPKALATFLKAERALRPIRSDHQTLYSNLLGNIGGLLHEQGRNPKAAHYLRRSMYWARDSWLHVSLNQIDLGGVLRVLEKSREAVQVLTRAERTLRRKGELLNLALCLNNLALAYEELGCLTKAIKLMEESLELKGNETAGLPDLGRGWMSFGEMLAKAKRTREAARAYATARKVLASIDDPKSRARIGYGEAGLLVGRGKMAAAHRLVRPLEAALTMNPSWRKERSFRNAVEPVRFRLGLIRKKP